MKRLIHIVADYRSVLIIMNRSIVIGPVPVEGPVTGNPYLRFADVLRVHADVDVPTDYSITVSWCTSGDLENWDE